MPDQKLLIQLVADYGTGDPAYAEVIQKLYSLDTNIVVNPVNVPKFSSLATGLWIYQLATVNPSDNLVIYSNTAPRSKLGLDESLTYKGNYGHLVYAELKNKVPVIAVHLGYNLSFIKPMIKNLYMLDVKNAGSQFRSRDFYPEAVISLARGKSELIGAKIPLESIADLPQNRLIFIDGYGNLKTSLKSSTNPFKPGQEITITLNGQTKKGVVGSETYHISDGELSLAPGSTGGDDKFLEIWIKGGSAYQTFNQPNIESEFTIASV